jgi:hypothetical protein
MRLSVRFNENPIESKSRLLYQDELDSLRRFEDHIYDSTGCYQSLKALRLTGICSYCREMTAYILTLFKPWAGRYLKFPTHRHLPIFVEIPRHFTITQYILNKLIKDDPGRSEPSYPAARYDERFYSITGSSANLVSRRRSFPVMYYRSTRRDSSIWYEEGVRFSLQRLKITDLRD